MIDIILLIGVITEYVALTLIVIKAERGVYK